MECPACQQQTIGVGAKILVALRARVRCPGCGAAVRFGLLPRVVHSVFGDALVAAGFVAALYYQLPVLLVAASGTWLILALVIPLSIDTRDLASRQHARLQPPGR